MQSHEISQELKFLVIFMVEIEITCLFGEILGDFWFNNVVIDTLSPQLTFISPSVKNNALMSGSLVVPNKCLATVHRITLACTRQISLML